MDAPPHRRRARRRVRRHPLTSPSDAGRPGSGEAIEYVLTREIINVSSVTYSGMFGDIGYMKVSNFAKRTAAEMEEALKELDDAILLDPSYILISIAAGEVIAPVNSPILCRPVTP